MTKIDWNKDPTFFVLFAERRWQCRTCSTMPHKFASLLPQGGRVGDVDSVEGLWVRVR